MQSILFDIKIYLELEFFHQKLLVFFLCGLKLFHGQNMDLPEILFIILIIVMIFSYCGFHLALRFCGPKSRHYQDSKILNSGHSDGN